jgi:hypothetical protein
MDGQVARARRRHFGWGSIDRRSTFGVRETSTNVRTFAGTANDERHPRMVDSEPSKMTAATS